LNALPDGYRALVVGASGGIGAAFVDALGRDPRCASVAAVHRGSSIRLDFDDEPSNGSAAAALAANGPFHLIVNAAGVLHNARTRPEKRLADLCYENMAETFRINAFGPALLLRHFTPLLAPGRSVFALLSAKVGSIGDNRLGGWTSYRASKAALNMIVRTAAIELARTRPDAVVVALHPGTVTTPLSLPFGGATRGRPPSVAVADMLATLDRLTAPDSGSFVAYDGERLPW
jgi:NAD(P)-dependent dehydrogenase (short-subunit alcohol dehydrogenase family)